MHPNDLRIARLFNELSLRKRPQPLESPFIVHYQYSFLIQARTPLNFMKSVLESIE